MFCAAPGRFSMITGCFHRAASLSATKRGKLSRTVPGGAGTTILISRVGELSCASAAAAAENSVATEMARSVLALSNCLIMTASSKKDQEWDRANVARVRRQKSWCSSPRPPADQAVIWLGRRDPGPSRGSTLADIAPTLKRLIASSAVVRSGEGKYAFRRISRMQRHLRPSNRNQGSPKERARVWINDRHASTSNGPD